MSEPHSWETWLDDFAKSIPSNEATPIPSNSHVRTEEDSYEQTEEEPISYKVAADYAELVWDGTHWAATLDLIGKIYDYIPSVISERAGSGTQIPPSVVAAEKFYRARMIETAQGWKEEIRVSSSPAAELTDTG
jgi:hypothetical protein